MKLYTCTDKHYTNSKIDCYLLRDLRSNKEIVVSAQELKQAMINKTADVMNLQLTSDNRLVEAGQDKMKSVINATKAPSRYGDSMIPLDIKEIDCAENIMDDLMKTCIEHYVKEHKKYVKLEHFNKENNTCVLEFTLGPNSFFTFRYEKACFGKIYKNNVKNLVFSIKVKALTAANKQESIKLDDSSIYDWPCEIEVDANNNFNINNYEETKNELGQEILRYVANEVYKLCTTNDNFIHNADIDAYTNADEGVKGGVKNIAKGAGLAVAVAGAIAATLVVDPTITQAALWAKSAGLSLLTDIIGTIAAGGVVFGGLFAGASSVGTVERGVLDIKEAGEEFERVTKHRSNGKDIKKAKKGLFNMFKR